MSYVLIVRLEKGISIFYLTHVDGQVKKEEVKEGDIEAVGGGRSNNPLPSAFDQQAFMEAIGTTTATIA